MSGDSFGSPPWDPAEPASEPERQPSGWEKLDSQWFKGGAAERRGGIRRASFTPSVNSPTAGRHRQQPPADQPREDQPREDQPREDQHPEPGSGRGWDVPADTSVDLFNAKTVRDAKRRKAAKEAPEGGKRRRGFWRELPVLVVIALVLALVIKAFVVQAFYIPSGSMQNTLAINDRVLINKLVYHTRPIERGDIVVFDGSGTWDPAGSGGQNIFAKTFGELEGLVGVSQDQNIFVKRVIGVPGDHVVCCNASGQVTVNGVALNESDFLFPGETAADSPTVSRYNVTVPAGYLWVLGDHTAVSDDSRGHMGDPGGGMIPESAVLGRAFVIIWPLSHWSFLNIPATFEQPRLKNSAG